MLKLTQKIKTIWAISILSVVLLAFGIICFWQFSVFKKESQDIDSQIDNQQDLVQKKEKSDVILYISDGDLWQSDALGKNKVKLIDRDVIQRASFSSNRERIAYSELRTVTEKVVSYEGVEEERTFKVRDLLLANERGANSILVKAGVNRWGWIPSTDLLWYETSSLQQLFGWIYAGNDDIWVFDMEKKKANLITTEKKGYLGILRPQWSPDGNKLSYVSDMNLMVVDRNTLEKKELLEIPYVGGDRGGAPPIPSLYWGNDSEYIYTAFTPLLFEPDKKNADFMEKYKSGYLSGWKIPINGDEPIQIIPEAPTPITNEEVFLSVIFNNDFSKVIYRRYEQEDIKGLEPYEWFYLNHPDREYLDYSLILYDMETQEEKMLIEGFKNYKINFNTWDFYSNGYGLYIFLEDDFLYFFANVGDSKNQVSIVAVDLELGESEEIYSFDFNWGEKLKGFKYDSQEGVIYFGYNNQIFSVKGKDVEKVLDNTSDVQYYFE